MKRSFLKKLVYVVVMVTLIFSTMLAEAATVVHLTPDYIGSSVPLQTYAPKKCTVIKLLMGVRKVGLLQMLI